MLLCHLAHQDPSTVSLSPPPVAHYNLPAVTVSVQDGTRCALQIGLSLPI